MKPARETVNHCLEPPASQPTRLESPGRRHGGRIPSRDRGHSGVDILVNNAACDGGRSETSARGLGRLVASFLGRGAVTTGLMPPAESATTPDRQCLRFASCASRAEVLFGGKSGAGLFAGAAHELEESGSVSRWCIKAASRTALPEQPGRKHLGGGCSTPANCDNACEVQPRSRRVSVEAIGEAAARCRRDARGSRSERSRRLLWKILRVAKGMSRIDRAGR